MRTMVRRRRNPYGLWFVPLIAAGIGLAAAATGGGLQLAATAKAKKGTPEGMAADLAKKQKQLARKGIFGPSKAKRARLAAEIVALQQALAQVGVSQYETGPAVQTGIYQGRDPWDSFEILPENTMTIIGLGGLSIGLVVMILIAVFARR